MNTATECRSVARNLGTWGRGAAIVQGGIAGSRKPNCPLTLINQSALISFAHSKFRSLGTGTVLEINMVEPVLPVLYLSEILSVPPLYKVKKSNRSSNKIKPSTTARSAPKFQTPSPYSTGLCSTVFHVHNSETFRVSARMRSPNEKIHNNECLMYICSLLEGSPPLTCRGV
jgi:hypothetical protein